MIILNKSNDSKVKVLSIFSNDEIAVAVDVNNIPQPEDIPGKRAELFYNKETKETYYEYFDIPLSETDELRQQVADLWETVLAGGNA